MRTAILAICITALSIVNAAPEILTASKCRKDKCQRVLLDRFVRAKRDCSSILRTTVVPARTTTTEVVTITRTLTRTQSFTTDVATISVTVTQSETETSTSTQGTITQTLQERDANGNLHARQQTKTNDKIPKYASACTDASQYSSACSCIGVTGSTTTKATPIVTKSKTRVTRSTPTTTIEQTATETASTITQTSTTTVTRIVQNPSTITQCAGPEPTFLLRNTAGGCCGDGYLFLADRSINPDGTINRYVNIYNRENAGSFSLDANDHLFGRGGIANNHGNPDETVFFTVPSSAASSLLICTLPEFGSGELTCSNAGVSTVLQYCGSPQTDPDTGALLDGLVIGTSLRSGCQALTLVAEPLCEAPP